jgi:Flp pilus assembly protein TadB
MISGCPQHNVSNSLHTECTAVEEKHTYFILFGLFCFCTGCTRVYKHRYTHGTHIFLVFINKVIVYIISSLLQRQNHLRIQDLFQTLATCCRRRHL